MGLPVRDKILLQFLDGGPQKSRHHKKRFFALDCLMEVDDGGVCVQTFGLDGGFVGRDFDTFQTAIDLECEPLGDVLPPR